MRMPFTITVAINAADVVIHERKSIVAGLVVGVLQTLESDVKFWSKVTETSEQILK